MHFGYMTLSDNYYRNNTRPANQLITDIADEAMFAEKVGMHSAWIGEHHFSTLGVLSCPDIVLAYVAAATKTLRLAPAVTVLPLHHPIRVAEQWATLDLLSNGRVDFACGRGYDRREYKPFKAQYENNTEVFAEGLEALLRLWTESKPVTHKGKYFEFEDISLTPKPIQNPIPTYVACFSRPSVELAARLGLNVIVAPFAMAMQFGGLKQFRDVYHESCIKHGKKPGKMICSYFTHFADNAEQEQAARIRQLRYFQECVLDALPGDPATAPPTYKYFISMVERLKNMKPEQLNDNSVLMGSARAITDSVAKVKDAGFDEVILYVNVGLKPHQQVKDEMQRFMEEVAPAFQAKRTAAE